jgi:ribokinase
MSVILDVVVVGSINVDMVIHGSTLPSAGSTVTGGVFERHGGGKGANQAVAAARLGARVGMIGAVGADGAGSDSLEELEREHVDVSNVVSLEGVATGVALIMVDERGENQIAVASGANDRVDSEMVEAALDDVELAESGVCLVGFELGDSAVEAAARWANSLGHTIVLDPAPARPILASIAGCHPIMTPNEGEARELTGEPETLEAARALARLTDGAVLVTLGSEGVLGVDHGDAFVASPYRVPVVDTTGAGDAFTGGVAVGLAGGLSLAESVDLGQAAAAMSAQHEGARTGMPTRNETMHLAREAASTSGQWVTS